ncbi:hypothetical protein [Streptomyces sp. NPDC021622]|uniref:hypothetical protein n=1 Tax=Streptomyces sp. NPDC021622 TaxID=3155013 RepID=UPI00340C7639
MRQPKITKRLVIIGATALLAGGAAIGTANATGSNSSQGGEAESFVVDQNTVKDHLAKTDEAKAAKSQDSKHGEECVEWRPDLPKDTICVLPAPIDVLPAPIDVLPAPIDSSQGTPAKKAGKQDSSNLPAWVDVTYGEADKQAQKN